MTVKLRQTGNSRTLTVPSGIKVTGEEYTVKNVGKTIVFTPVAKRKNIFATKDWKEYDYQIRYRKRPSIAISKTSRT